jgi:hypothetical protein
MANDKNFFDINGVLYAKDTRKIPNKKEPDKPDWEFRSIILEIKTVSGSKTYTELPQFQLGNGVSFDEYSIGDFINVRFAISGKIISPTFHKTELRATFIKFADIQTKEDKKVDSSNQTSDYSFLNTETHKGKIKVDDNKVFANSVPEMKEDNPDWQDDDLPF